MIDGGDCTCAAWHESECACDADWTTQEVYDLREEVQQLREANKLVWTSVDEQLPEIKRKDGWSDDVFVLTNINSGGAAAYNENGYWDTVYVDYQLATERVTYWMPIPKSPEESK